MLPTSTEPVTLKQSTVKDTRTSTALEIFSSPMLCLRTSLQVACM